MSDSCKCPIWDTIVVRSVITVIKAISIKVVCAQQAGPALVEVNAILTDVISSENSKNTGQRRSTPTFGVDTVDPTQ